MRSLHLVSSFDLQDAMEIAFSNTAEGEGSTSNAERKSDSPDRVRLQGCAKTERLLAYILHEVLWNAMCPRIAFERLMGKQKRRSGSTAALECSENRRGQRLLQGHLYLTEQPYGFVCGVVTALPDSDSSKATFT